jgi:sterol 14alpha-demethylase
MRKVISPMTVPPSLAAPPSSSSSNSFYIIPSGYYLLAAPGVACVDPEIWDNPNGFDPYRWIIPNKDSNKPSPISFAQEDDGEKVDFGWGKISTGANSPYLPFGAGRHRCIGEQFANVQLGTVSWFSFL